jgi:hypothetical protein
VREEPQPGVIHPLIAAVMEPERAPAAARLEPQRFMLEPPAIAVPADLVLKGWKVAQQRSGLYVGHNQRVPVSTHAYTTPAGTIAAAQEYQRWIEDIEALDWTIHRAADDPQLLTATHPRHAVIAPVRGLYTLRQRVMEWAAASNATPELGTQTTTAETAQEDDRPATTSPGGIVPQVLVVAGQPNPYEVPERTICDVLGHTAEMVSCRYPDGRVGKRRQENVYCLPSPEAAQRVEAAFTRYQATLTAIADELRSLGTYADRLAAAGGIDAAPNHLTSTVIFATEPDDYHAPSFDHALKVPFVERSTVRNHTAKMLRIAGSAATISGQQGHFVCPDDAAWARMQHYRAAAVQAHDELIALLDELGTYQAALTDGRYVQTDDTPVSTPTIDWQRVHATAAQLSVCNVQRDRDGLISAAFDLLRLVAAPSQIVLPLYPTDQAGELIAEIRVLLEQQLDVATPHVGRLLRAIGRFVDVPPNDNE